LLDSPQDLPVGLSPCFDRQSLVNSIYIFPWNSSEKMVKLGNSSELEFVYSNSCWMMDSVKLGRLRLRKYMISSVFWGVIWRYMLEVMKWPMKMALAKPSESERWGHFLPWNLPYIFSGHPI
jgi:hypothetical protein